ncbi:MAG: hypothetical protein M9909_09570 [Thermomicrobiales bacterium]|nr:hypothetical protein [Thermomicrobiales bacterium]
MALGNALNFLGRSLNLVKLSLNSNTILARERWFNWRTLLNFPLLHDLVEFVDLIREIIRQV